MDHAMQVLSSIMLSNFLSKSSKKQLQKPHCKAALQTLTNIRYGEISALPWTE